jgi:hypothetical protein
MTDDKVQQFIENIVEGRVYKYTHLKVFTTRLINKIICEFQKIYDPTDEQLEAFGGVICYMLSRPSHHSAHIINEDWNYMIQLCIDHPDAEYLIACIMFAILSRFQFRSEESQTFVYETMVFFTKRYDLTYPPSWSTVLICVWNKYFCEIPHGRDEMFFSDVDLVKAFFKLCTCPSRRIISTEHRLMEITDVFIRSGLQNVDPLKGDTSLDIVYNLLHSKQNLCEVASNVWPFLLRDGKIITLREFEVQIKLYNDIRIVRNASIYYSFSCFEHKDIEII